MKPTEELNYTTLSLRKKGEVPLNINYNFVAINSYNDGKTYCKDSIIIFDYIFSTIFNCPIFFFFKS